MFNNKQQQSVLDVRVLCITTVVISLVLAIGSASAQAPGKSEAPKTDAQPVTEKADKEQLDKKPLETDEEKRIQSYLRSLMIPFGKRPTAPPRVPYRRITPPPQPAKPGQQTTAGNEANPNSMSEKCPQCNSQMLNGKCTSGKCTPSIGGAGSSSGSNSSSSGPPTNPSGNAAGSAADSRSGSVRADSGSERGKSNQNDNGAPSARTSSISPANAAGTNSSTRMSTAGQSELDSAQGNATDSASNTGALQNLQALGLLPRASMPQRTPDAGQGDSGAGQGDSGAGMLDVGAKLPSENPGNSNGQSGLDNLSSPSPGQPGSSGLSSRQMTTTTNSQNSNSSSGMNSAPSSLLAGAAPTGKNGAPDQDSSAQPSGAMDPLGVLGANPLGGLNSILNTPIPISDPTIRGALDSAAGAMVPSTWEVVRPAGVGKTDADPGLSMNDADSVSTDSDADAKQLDGGVMRMALRTGPMNPLVLPPDFDSVVYVIDTSGSMVGGKFQQVSRALVDAVGQMQSNQKFAVILFNTLAMRAKGTGYRNADASVVQALSSELGAITPVGGTDPTDALLIALQMKPQTIVVLSDGEFEPMVVNQVTRLNRVSGLNSQINCIAIGANVLTLQQLAARNGPGNYVEAN